jgi:hypothetical protein
MRKHGVHNFTFEVIFCTKDINNLESIEDFFIKQYDSIKEKNGYNMIFVKESRKYIRDLMKKQWSNPITRQKRLKIQADVAKSRQIPIIAVDVYNGDIKEYQSVNGAIRAGFSGSAITECLKKRTKVGQGFVWLYKNTDNTWDYKSEAEQLLGGFKRDFLIPILGWNDSGEKIEFKDSFALKPQGFEPKAVRRVCRGERKQYKGYYWRFK